MLSVIVPPFWRAFTKTTTLPELFLYYQSLFLLHCISVKFGASEKLF